MIMKKHILLALGEEYDAVEDLLAGIPVDLAENPMLPSPWSVKDVVAHLGAWQQRSIARVRGALADHEPEFPHWLAGLDPELEENTDQINDWIYRANHGKAWELVHHEWRAGYFDFMDLGAKVYEKDLLDSARYPWLNGYPLVQILLSYYDHHREHREELLNWLKGQEMGGTSG